MPSSNKWLNYGDVNPREHGGIFIRYDPEDQMYEILQTTSTKDFDDLEFSYLFEHVFIEKDTLLEDKGLQSFAGINIKEPIGEKEIIYIATSYIPYYGAEDDCYQVDNYWGELKTYGIYPARFNK